MDSKSLRILYIIPGFDEGGAEVHVLNLINELSLRHEITLISSGGRLESSLPEKVMVINMPVHRKNLFTGIYCALKLRSLSKKFRWDIVHVHSRVPAFIAWLAGMKYIFTAHALYSLNAGLIPLRHSEGVICISQAVRKHIKKYLPAHNKDKVIIIPNGIIKSGLRHNYSGKITRFLFAGRLTRLKGLDTALRALSELVNYEWTFDILGEGPQYDELVALTNTLDLSNRVTFHGAVNKSQVNNFMSQSSCLLFPSYSEGMGLVVLEAVSIGLKVIASDLEALHELSGSNNNLVKPGDVASWNTAIKHFLDTGEASNFDSDKIITVHEMAVKTERFYYKHCNG